ncbi:tRNA (adenosine(37)-N6)-threonylcarbamoyltransferase complex ATPase subunit type 1 TsaE [bacterium]|nr:tRNA (adenosine(37)-N6)-threonylcarbamoyltransferase complex ATPase subunit type 1 TsaE [bacterium]
MSRSPKETEEVGMKLARELPKGSVLILEGEMGSGKTVFVRGVVSGMGGDPSEVVSPTYLGAIPYETPLGCVLHADLYRRQGFPEEKVKWLEAFLEEEPTLLVVEWGKAPPFPCWEVHFTDKGGMERGIKIIRHE